MSCVPYLTARSPSCALPPQVSGGAAGEALSLSLSPSAPHSGTRELSTASAGGTRLSPILFLDHCCPSLWRDTQELCAGRPRYGARPCAHPRGTEVGHPGACILHPLCPGSAPLGVPLLPSLAEPGFPLLAVRSQGAGGLQASRGARACWWQAVGQIAPLGLRPRTVQSQEGQIKVWLPQRLRNPHGLAISGQKGAGSPGPGPCSGSVFLLWDGCSPCAGHPVQDSSFCMCLVMLCSLLQSCFLASLSITLGLSLSAPTAAASRNPKSPKCCFSSNPCH